MNTIKFSGLCKFIDNAVADNDEVFFATIAVRGTNWLS